jgi:hypothetical protein
LCTKCLSRARKDAKTQRIKHIEIGGCITCGKPPMPGTVTCEGCAKRATNATVKRYDKNKNSGVCPFCGGELNNNFRCDDCHNNHLRWGRELWHKNRKLILEHYGNKCICCGETAYEFLELDHINNDGAAHRKETGRHVYEWVIKNNFPPDIQLLCANCNRGKAKYNACPHKQTVELTRYRKRRLRCIAHYGSKCVCCGEDNWAFLEFDHVNNDGSKHRKESGYSSLVRWIVKNGFPPTIQLLCSNCNKAKGLYGSCPH